MGESAKDAANEHASVPPSVEYARPGESRKAPLVPMIEAFEGRLIGNSKADFISTDAPDRNSAGIAHRLKRARWAFGSCILLALAGLLLVVSVREIVTRTRRARSAQQLSALGMAMQFYANGNRNAQFPDSLSTLMVQADLTPEVFVYPGGSDTPAHGATWQAQQNDFARPGHCSYLYFGRVYRLGAIQEP